MYSPTPSDKERLNWLESQYKLHAGAEFLYVVDGYQLALTIDETPVLEVHGTDLRDAIDKAMKQHPQEGYVRGNAHG